MTFKRIICKFSQLSPFDINKAQTTGVGLDLLFLNIKSLNLSELNQSVSQL